MFPNRGISLEVFFATCPRGLEASLASELELLGAESVLAIDGGVSFGGEFRLCYKVNLESRIASRVLWKIASYRYTSENDIYDATFQLPWKKWFHEKRSIRVAVTATKCPLKSLEFVTLKIKDAICDKFRQVTNDRPSIQKLNPDIRIHAYLNETESTLYIDTSGEPLFKRGMRIAQNEAGIKENLAAGLLRLSQWTPEIPLLDPMCGGGTILIEAALIALDIAPGLNRSFAFEKLHHFDKARWEALRVAAQARRKVVVPLSIYGSDLYGDALKAARTNLAHTGLEHAVSLKQANVLEISAPAEKGMIVTNPPYGVRLGEQDELSKFYPVLGDALKKKFAGWDVFLFSGDMRLPKLIGLNPSRRTPLFNGGLECRLFKFVMVEGQMRRKKTGEELTS